MSVRIALSHACLDLEKLLLWMPSETACNRRLLAQPVADVLMIVIRNRLSTLTPQSGLTPTSLWTSVLDGANFTAIAAANGLDATLTYYNATITCHTVRRRLRMIHALTSVNLLPCLASPAIVQKHSAMKNVLLLVRNADPTQVCMSCTRPWKSALG